MSKILVKTGFGFYQDTQLHIIAKAQLPPGSHDLADGLIYIEVESQAELDAVNIWQDPADQQAAEQNTKIQNKLREFAIAELIKDGQWP